MFGFLRSSFVPGLILLGVCACSLFAIKYHVQLLNKNLKGINAEILETKKNIHVLKAELTYLSKPEKIKKISDEKLDLVYASKSQVISQSKFKNLVNSKLEEKRIKEINERKKQTKTDQEGGT